MKKIIICVLCIALLCTALCACSLTGDRGLGNANRTDNGTVTDTPDKTDNDLEDNIDDVVPTAIPGDQNTKDQNGMGNDKSGTKDAKNSPNPTQSVTP